MADRKLAIWFVLLGKAVEKQKLVSIESLNLLYRYQPDVNELNLVLPLTIKKIG